MLAIVAAVAEAQGEFVYGCLLGKAEKQLTECRDQIGNFHVLCGPSHWGDASDACIAQGWRLAVLDDSNKFDALLQVRNCTPGNTWIASFNGVEAAGCFQFRGDAPIIETELPVEYCLNEQQAILCEEVPVETVTTTSFVESTTVPGIKTKTIEVIPTCPYRPIHPCKPHYRDSQFAILRERLPYAQAECACKQLNMHLADLTIFNFLDASHELYKELGASKHAWIRSWNGDKYAPGTCLALWTGASGPGGAIAQPRSCDEPIPVVCQRPHRPACPCEPRQHDCECYRPHRHHRYEKADQKEQQDKPKKEQNIFFQFSDAKPIFASQNEKQVYENKLAAFKRDQAEKAAQKRAEEEKKRLSDDDEYVPEQDGLIDPEADKCIAGHGPCPRVCKYRAPGIRLVKVNATAYDADEVCRRFGWTLLDYKSCQERDVRYLKKKCCAGDEGLWIRSYNGVDGGACMQIDGSTCEVPVGWVLSADDCVNLGGQYVLCQCRDAVFTTSGTFIGSETYTTTTVDGTKTFTSFTATVTTTVTLLQD